MAQLMPLPLTASCFSKIQIGFAFLVPARPGSPGKRAVKRVCVASVRLSTGPSCLAGYRHLTSMSQINPRGGIVLQTEVDDQCDKIAVDRRKYC